MRVTDTSRVRSVVRKRTTRIDVTGATDRPRRQHIEIEVNVMSISTVARPKAWARRVMVAEVSAAASPLDSNTSPTCRQKSSTWNTRLVRGDVRPDGSQQLNRRRPALQDVACLTAQEVAHSTTESGHGASMRARCATCQRVMTMRSVQWAS